MKLLNIPIKDITASNLKDLVKNKQSESTMIDFKRDTYGGSDADKKELIKDTSALANTRGGMILIGIDEVDGDASELTPVAGNTDKEIQRLNSILQSSIEPIIPGVEIHAVSINKTGHVILIKVPASWSAPHRTNSKGSKRFYRRNSSGVYEPDVTELKKMFNASIEQNNQFRKLRHEHINAVHNGETPVEMPDESSGYLLLQMIPLQSIGNSYHLDLNAQNLRTSLRGDGWDHRYNIDGFLAFRPPCHSYTQIYRNGIIEAVICSISGEKYDKSGRKIIPGSYLSINILAGTARYLGMLQSMGVQTPIRVYVTLLDVKNCRFATYYDSFGRGKEEIPNIEKSDARLPPVDIMDYGHNFKIYESLRPVMDALWSADNRERCDYYDDEGKWVGHKDVSELRAF